MKDCTPSVITLSVAVRNTAGILTQEEDANSSQAVSLLFLSLATSSPQMPSLSVI